MVANISAESAQAREQSNVQKEAERARVLNQINGRREAIIMQKEQALASVERVGEDREGMVAQKIVELRERLEVATDPRQKGEIEQQLAVLSEQKHVIAEQNEVYKQQLRNQIEIQYSSKLSSLESSKREMLSNLEERTSRQLRLSLLALAEKFAFLKERVQAVNASKPDAKAELGRAGA